jgi:hypothetical protein
MGVICSMHGKYEKCIQNLTPKTWRNQSTVEDNVKQNIKGIGYEDVDWIYLAQDNV